METRATANATKTALVAGTVVSRSQLLNGADGNREAHAAAWPGSPAAEDAPRSVTAFPREPGFRQARARFAEAALAAARAPGLASARER